jgi:peptidylprolyl isomerase/peptidyl-prolyl cis-trans isomerase B (cyclophilin B)
MKEINMETWKRIVLWLAVVALVFSFAVCQKKVEKAKDTEAPKETELSAAPEETKAPESKPMEEKPAMIEEEKAKSSEEMSEQPAEEITRDNAAAIIELQKGGQIVMEFYPQDAPNTVDNFIKLAEKGFYDGLTFHRVVPGFVVQGGDPQGNGTGGPGYKIKAEFNSRKHLTGTLAMARSSHPDSAGSQFYICLEPQPGLDGQYTVFGQVIEGMDLVQGIQVGDVMKKVTIVDKDTVKKE